MDQDRIERIQGQTHGMWDHMKRRAVYFALTLVVIVLGLASRRFGAQLPPFVAAYSGDTLWALAAFLGLSTLVPGVSLRWRAVIALGFSFAIEISQLYHAPWIDSIRATTIGGLILGFGFLWSDLACYTVGVITGALGETVLRRRSRTRHRKPRAS